jgi:hypothetical protein
MLLSSTLTDPLALLTPAALPTIKTLALLTVAADPNDPASIPDIWALVSAPASAGPPF